LEIRTNLHCNFFWDVQTRAQTRFAMSSSSSSAAAGGEHLDTNLYSRQLAVRRRVH
jgi:hypothetical protein